MSPEPRDLRRRMKALAYAALGGAGGLSTVWLSRGCAGACSACWGCAGGAGLLALSVFLATRKEAKTALRPAVEE